MGKGDARTKAKKNRRKLDAVTAGLPDLAPSQKREKSGRKSRVGKSANAGIETKKARCRQMGLEITPANIRAMGAEWWGCYAGRVIGERTMERDERAELWGAIKHMRAVTARHDAAMGIPNRHPACMRLLATSGGDIGPKGDESPEDRVRRTAKDLMQVEGWLGYTDKPAASEAKRVVIHDEHVADPDGLILALRCIADGLKGRTMVYRGRR